MNDSLIPASPQAPRPYVAPTLEVIGDVERITMGNNGSSIDGNGSLTQRGQGNDGLDRR